MKLKLVVLILLLHANFSYSFEILKFEVALKKQKESELKLANQFKLKVFKAKKAILVKYLTALNHQLRLASSSGNLELSQKVKAKVSSIQGEIYSIDSLLKRKVPVKSKELPALKSSDFEYYNETDVTPDFSKLSRGKQCFKKGGFIKKMKSGQ